MRDLLRRTPALLGLIAWTLIIWASRVRNIVADDELDGAQRLVALAVAVGFVIGASLVIVAFLRRWSAAPHLLAALAIAGIVRWSVRGPIILSSDEWSVGFKMVHTILWTVTVVLSAAAWIEMRRRRA